MDAPATKVNDERTIRIRSGAHILDWYDAEARELPWRNNPYPWPVLVSEFVHYNRHRWQ